MKLLRNFTLPALLFADLACASQAQTDGTLKVKSGQKIAFLGDSITWKGWDQPGGYVRLVVAGLESAGVKVIPIPAGASGNTSRDMLARVDRDVIDRKADWMLLSCGVNDVWHGATGVDLETYKANIASLVNKVQAAGIKVMILTATVINENDNPDNQKLAAYNDFLRQLATKENLPLADLNAAFWKALKAAPPSPGENRLTVDGVHMNPAGNMLMARGILEAFGMSPAELDKIETAWRNAPDAGCATASIIFNENAGISLSSFNSLQAIARERKMNPIVLENGLLFNALRAVLKAHEQDAALTQVQIQAELQRAFGEQVEAFLKTEK